MSKIISLDENISSMVTEVNPELRSLLQTALRTLRDAGDIPGAILDCSRLLEGERGLVGLIALTASNRKLKGFNLEAQLEELAQTGVLPAEIASDLHWVRIRANKARHNVEKVSLTESDAETALYFVLRAVEWFYCSCPFNPRPLSSLYLTAAAAPVTLACDTKSPE